MFDESRVSDIKDSEKIEKPWGYEIIWAKTKNYVAKVMQINPDNRMSLQFHQKKEETIYVMAGVLRVWETEDDKVYKDLPAGMLYHVNPGEVHRFGSPKGTYGTMLMEISTNHLDDVVRIKDDYDR
jgi:mannose-6-phosphate isomerase